MKTSVAPLALALLVGFGCGSDTLPPEDRGNAHESDMAVGDFGPSADAATDDLGSEADSDGMSEAADMGSEDLGSDMALHDMAIADSGTSTDAGNPTDATDAGNPTDSGNDMSADAGGEGGVYVAGPVVTIPNRTTQQRHPMKVAWGAGDDVIWSVDYAQIVNIDGTIVKTLPTTPNNVGGGVAVAFADGRYYTAHIYKDPTTIVNPKQFPVVRVFDTSGNQLASAQMPGIDPMQHIELAWNGAAMGVFGVNFQELIFFETGATPDANQTATGLTPRAGAYHNNMTSLLWDGDAYCSVRANSSVRFVCNYPDGTSKITTTVVGDTNTSYQPDMAHGGNGEYFFSWMNLDSGAPNRPWSYFLSKYDANGNVTEKRVYSATLAETFRQEFSLAHDGTNLLVASAEDGEGFFTVYDGDLNELERHALGPAANIDLDVSGNRVVVAFAPPTFDSVVLARFGR